MEIKLPTADDIIGVFFSTHSMEAAKGIAKWLHSPDCCPSARELIREAAKVDGSTRKVKYIEDLFKCPTCCDSQRIGAAGHWVECPDCVKQTSAYLFEKAKRAQRNEELAKQAQESFERISKKILKLFKKDRSKKLSFPQIEKQVDEDPRKIRMALRKLYRDKTIAEANSKSGKLPQYGLLKSVWRLGKSKKQTLSKKPKPKRSN
jgi:hypothetical protein